MRHSWSFAAVVALIAFNIHSSAFADEVGDGATESAHTFTWWCTDLNEFFKVEVPVIIGLANAVPPDPSPIPDPCTNPFPVLVPNGSAFLPGGVAVWFTNLTYPPALAAALEDLGISTHSQSPSEDFMHKLVAIRVEVRNFDDGLLVAEYTYDPRRNFRKARTREFFGAFPFEPLIDPSLGLDLSVDAIGRLPLIGFPVIAGPVPPGHYRAAVYWTLSEAHNDGLGLDDGNFLPAGETRIAFPPFIVLP